MRTLITGSIAYDTIMVFPDRFRNHLLPDQLHILNVCFLTPEMRREFGGTAGNIAYNLKQLGGDPLVMATVAPDGKEGMLQHARECAAHGIAFLFDPGQGLPMFSAEELLEFVRLADYVAVNDYEGKLLEEKTGRKLEDLARDVKALVVTR